MTIDPKKSGASPSAPTWSNWSGNIVHEPPTNGANYYFRPTDLVELKSVLADAVTKGVTVRASGQRHSQPPLVTNDNRGAVPPTSCVQRLLTKSCDPCAPNTRPMVRRGRHELIINLKTAKDLGMTIPQELIARANRIIQ